MTKKVWAGIAVVLLLVAGLFVVLSRHDTSQPDEYRIGVLLSLTGRGATYGQRALKGMQIALDELNETAQFRTHPLKLLVEDTQSSASRALSGFRKLIDIDHVPVVVGLVLSDEVLTCAPVANEREVVLLSTAAGSDKIKDAGDYIFRNRESATLQADAIAKASIQRFGIKEIAILHSNAANGISYRNRFKDAVQRLGGTILMTVGYNEGKTDYRAEIEQLRGNSPNSVYLAGLDNELGLILKQAKEVGFTAQFFASAGAISQKLLDIAGSGAEGLVCGSAPFNTESDDPCIRDFVLSFRTRFGEQPDWIAANSYDAIYMLSALFKDGAKDADQIKDSLYAMKDFPGVGGRTTFDANGEVAKPISLVMVRNGTFVSLENNSHE